MKTKLFFISVFTCIYFLSPAQSNSESSGWGWGVRAGYNSTNFEEYTKIVDWRSSFHAGLFAERSISKSINVELGLLFSSQGSGRENSVDMRFNYLHLPLVGKLYLGQKFNLFLGPQLGYLISAYQGDGKFAREGLNSFEFSGLAGFGYDFQQFNLQFRYAHGFTKAAKYYYGTDDPVFQNRVMQLSIGVPLGGY